MSPLEHYIIVDTEARPHAEDMRELADNCDLLILPTKATALDLHALLKTVEILETLHARYRVLLTMVRPPRRTDKHTKRMAAREFLQCEQVSLFQTEIQLLAVFEDAPDEGAVVKDLSGLMAAKAWASYCSLGQEIEAEMCQWQVERKVPLSV